ncbi:hypothetical protein C2G38_1195034 [Gigaspora rosea]|uniref:Uncharacterized protein n=1 Tax=Gigaspora rosea TaxID=44941 RepID=A0A397VKL3_9GLOM|nr:hypothetical protein C2G38_1195034 [Gigaspora rosea]
MADFMLLILSAKVEVDQFGELCLKAIQSQGFPSVILSNLFLLKILVSFALGKILYIF